MALISLPYTFTVGAVIIAAQHNSNFSTIYNDYNGNIQDANIASNAGIEYSKLSLSASIEDGDLASGVGSSAGNLVKLNGSAQLPAVSGALLNNQLAPILSVHNTGTQSISKTSWTQMTFNTVDIDSGSYWASNTYTPLVAGWYLVTYFDVCNVAAAGAVQTAIYKNGSLYATAENVGPATSSVVTATVTAIIQMNGSTDNVSFYLYTTATGGCTSNNPTSGSLGSFASIARVY